MDYHSWKHPDKADTPNQAVHKEGSTNEQNLLSDVPSRLLPHEFHYRTTSKPPTLNAGPQPQVQHEMANRKLRRIPFRQASLDNSDKLSTRFDKSTNQKSARQPPNLKQKSYSFSGDDATKRGFKKSDSLQDTEELEESPAQKISWPVAVSHVGARDPETAAMLLRKLTGQADESNGPTTSETSSHKTNQVVYSRVHQSVPLPQTNVLVYDNGADLYAKMNEVLKPQDPGEYVTFDPNEEDPYAYESLD